MNDIFYKNNKRQDRLLTTLIIMIVVYFFCNVANAKTIKVAVIDSGFNQELFDVPLCDTGHFDFITDKELVPRNANYEEIHGSHIAGTIVEYAKDADYCLIIMRYWSKQKVVYDPTMDNVVKAIKRAIDYDVDIINMSFGGKDENLEETKIVKKALDLGIKIVAAAGNERLILDIFPFYPACADPRVHIVEALDQKGSRLPASNYLVGGYFNKCGNTNVFKETGTITLKTRDNKSLTMSGTSQATAVKTGKLIKYMSDYNKANEAYLKDKYFNRSK